MMCHIQNAVFPPVLLSVIEQELSGSSRSEQPIPDGRAPKSSGDRVALF